MKRFWMVYGIGQARPVYQHATFESASNEAKRLAAQNTDITFVVLSAVRAYRTPPTVVEVEIFDESDHPWCGDGPR